MRIVSLLASATETVCALGLGEHLVGISHECDYPPEALDKPRVSRPRFDPSGLTSGEIDRAVRAAMTEHGSVYELDRDLLRDLAPDLIIAQAVCDVCAVPTSLATEAAALLDGRPRVLSLDSHTVDQILEGITSVGTAAAAARAAETLVSEYNARLDRVRQRVRGVARPRVLAVEWLDPPFLPGHWVPQMIDLAGGEPLECAAARPSRQVNWSDLAALDPDVLVIMPCGFGLSASHVDATAHQEELVAVAGRALGAGRAYVVDGSAYFNRSGPRMVDGVEIMGALLHPELFPEVELDGRAAVWYPVA
ncbi:MAG: cobalamin-binding protein [Gemmatimonadota bacterium]|nr:cobalamin-binding protein [Gemmatimonadota bacterium]